MTQTEDAECCRQNRPKMCGSQQPTGSPPQKRQRLTKFDVNLVKIPTFVWALQYSYSSIIAVSSVSIYKYIIACSPSHPIPFHSIPSHLVSSLLTHGCSLQWPPSPQYSLRQVHQAFHQWQIRWFSFWFFLSPPYLSLFPSISMCLCLYSVKPEYFYYFNYFEICLNHFLSLSKILFCYFDANLKMVLRLSCTYFNEQY